jgi:acylphosphatase
MKRVRARVTGLVQGVFYRATAAERAQELGLSGWVRNLRDGAVELEAQGPEERVTELVEWCRRGPPAARVSAVETEWLPVNGEERGFRVRR